MRQNSLSVSIAAAFNQTGTALQNLRALTGADKVGRHDAIVQQVGIIFALALAKEPSKGCGNPADHAKLAQVFTDAKMPRYADALIGAKVALKVKGFRSVEAWDDALAEGFAMADGMLCDLRPKVYTKAELAAREAKSAERKQAKELERKVAEESAKAMAEKQVADAYAKGRAEASTPVTAQMVADMIRSGGFDTDGLCAIAAALDAVFPRVDTATATATV